MMASSTPTPIITRVSARTSFLLRPAEATSSDKTCSITAWRNAKCASETFLMFEKEDSPHGKHDDGNNRDGGKKQQLANETKCILECDAPSIAQRIVSICPNTESSPSGHPSGLQNGFRLFATFSGVMYKFSSARQSVNSKANSSMMNDKMKSHVTATDKVRRKNSSISFRPLPVPAQTFSFPAILLDSSLSSQRQTPTMPENTQVSHDTAPTPATLKSHKVHENVCDPCALPTLQSSPHSAQQYGDRTANILPNKGIALVPSTASSCVSCGISCTSGTLADFVFALTSCGNTAVCGGGEAEGRDTSTLSLLVEQSEDDQNSSRKTHSPFSHQVKKVLSGEKSASWCGNSDNPETRRNDLEKSSSLILAAINEACDRRAPIATAATCDESKPQGRSETNCKNNNEEADEWEKQNEREREGKTQNPPIKTLGDFLLPLLPHNILRRISEWQFTVDLLLALNPNPPPSAGPPQQQQGNEPSCKVKSCRPHSSSPSGCSCPVSTTRSKDNGAGSSSKRLLTKDDDRRMRRHYRRDLKNLKRGGLKDPSKRHSAGVNDHHGGGEATISLHHRGVCGEVTSSSFNIWALSTPSDPPFLSGAGTVTCEECQHVWGGHVRTPTRRSTCRTTHLGLPPRDDLSGSACVSGKSRVEIKRKGNRLANKAGQRGTPCGLRAFPCPATPSPSPSSPTYSNSIPSQQHSSSPHSFSTTLAKTSTHTYMHSSSSSSGYSETSGESDHERGEHTVDSALLTPISQVRRSVRKCGTARFTVDEDGVEHWPPSIDIDTLGLPLDYVD